jgi:hypothetical protein
MTIRTASIHRGGTAAGVTEFVGVAMLDEEHITLEAWDIMQDLEERASPKSSARLFGRTRRRSGAWKTGLRRCGASCRGFATYAWSAAGHSDAAVSPWRPSFSAGCRRSSLGRR